MRIFQILPSFVSGDAIGNEVIMFDNILRNHGFETYIFYENATDYTKSISYHYSLLPKINLDDLVIFHMSISSIITEIFLEMKCKKIMIYHNITPYNYYYGYDINMTIACKKGLEEVRFLFDKVDYCITHSIFSKKNLENIGYLCKIDVMPILLSFDDYKEDPSKIIINKFSDDFINIVSIGRINAPNKRWENIIKVFYFFQKYIESKSRLFLVGTFESNEVYPQRLKNFVNYLKLNNVIFTGHIPFNELLSYLKISDIYLCMSEHEGFCVPLLEAMFFNIPVVAYSTTAIPYTLENAGFLIKNHNPLEVAFIMKKILEDNSLHQEIIKNQKKRMSYFETKRVSKIFMNYIDNFLKNNYA